MAHVLLLAALFAWSGAQARACPDLEGWGSYTAKVDIAETRAGAEPEAFRVRHPYALGWFPPGEALPFVLTSPRGVRLTEGEIAVLHEKLNDPEAADGGAVVNYWFGGIDPRKPPSANLAQTLGPEGLLIYRKLQRFLRATLRGARPAVLAGLRERLDFWRGGPVALTGMRLEPGAFFLRYYVKAAPHGPEHVDPEFTITSSIAGPSTVIRWGTDRTALFSRGTHHAVPESEPGRMLLIGHFHVRAKIDGEWMRLRTEF